MAISFFFWGNEVPLAYQELRHQFHRTASLLMKKRSVSSAFCQKKLSLSSYSIIPMTRVFYVSIDVVDVVLFEFRSKGGGQHFVRKRSR
jgi:hypothetical protein